MHYVYERGDFILHFPGGMKNHIDRYVEELLVLQPELKKINDANKL
jgi:hypothetical protein